MKKIIAAFLFTILLTTATVAHAATLEPDISVGMMSSTNGLESSVKLALGFDQIIDLPRIGNSQLLISADVSVDMGNGFNAFANGGNINLSELAGRITNAEIGFAWQSPLKSGLDSGLFSISGSFQATITATGERAYNLSIAPSMEWSTKIGGQDVTFRSSLEMDFGMDRISTFNALENDHFYKQIYKR